MTPTEEGFLGMLQSKPAILAGLVCAVVLIFLGVILAIYCYKRKKNRKTRGLHGKSIAYSHARVAGVLDSLLSASCKVLFSSALFRERILYRINLSEKHGSIKCLNLSN